MTRTQIVVVVLAGVAVMVVTLFLAFWYPMYREYQELRDRNRQMIKEAQRELDEAKNKQRKP